MTRIKLQHSVAASIVSFAASMLIFTTTVFGGDVYFGSFNNDGGQWALVNNHSHGEPVGFHFIGFVAERRQLIVGSRIITTLRGAIFGNSAG
jgi:hypothetical protein